MPLLRPPPPPTAPPGCGRRRLGGRRTRRSKRRDWAELPLDVMLQVLHKLDHVELMFGGPAMVCRSWHDAVCEPELWRRVDMRGRSPLFRETISLRRMARLSIWFSAGQCQEFFGQKDVDDDLLLFLAERAPLLKGLHLTECCGVTSKAFTEAIKKFPLLEELELWESDINDTGVFEVVATACPRLKHFNHVNDREYPPYRWSVNNREAMAIARMHELRSLKLLRGGLDNKGLKAILDGCGHLESLDIRYCSNVIVDSSLQAKCAGVKTKLRYTYVWERYHPEIRPDLNEYFELCSPISYSTSAYNRHRGAGDEHDCRFFFVEEVETSDSEDSDHSRYFSGAEETEFEYWHCVGA